MTLHRIVRVLGGTLYQGGTRANVPAPGHSPEDRSVSLLLSGDRLVIHSFGAADWRDVRDHLEGLGLIDSGGRLAGGGHTPGPGPRPDQASRIAVARRLWEDARPLTAGGLSHRYLTGRAVASDPARLHNLRHHPAAPVSVFRPAGAVRPALVARIGDAEGRLTAVELVYLDPNGRRAERLRLSRKTVGAVPPGSAVRLFPVQPTLLVGEGVLTVLSACEHHGLCGWALLSAHNLAAWRSPAGVERVVIAADRGRTGETAAVRLRRRLEEAGVRVSVRLPPAGCEDWNAAAAERRRREEGTPGRRCGGDGPRRSAGDRLCPVPHPPDGPP